MRNSLSPVVRDALAGDDFLLLRVERGGVVLESWTRVPSGPSNRILAFLHRADAAGDRIPFRQPAPEHGTRRRPGTRRAGYSSGAPLPPNRRADLHGRQVSGDAQVRHEIGQPGQPGVADGSRAGRPGPPTRCDRTCRSPPRGRIGAVADSSRARAMRRAISAGCRRGGATGLQRGQPRGQQERAQHVARAGRCGGCGGPCQSVSRRTSCSAPGCFDRRRGVRNSAGPSTRADSRGCPRRRARRIRPHRRMVVDAVALSGPRGRVVTLNEQHQRGLAGQQGAGDRALAPPPGTGEHDAQSAAPILWLVVIRCSAPARHLLDRRLEPQSLAVSAAEADLRHSVLASRSNSWVRKSRRAAHRRAFDDQCACRGDVAGEPVHFLPHVGAGGGNAISWRSGLSGSVAFAQQSPAGSFDQSDALTLAGPPPRSRPGRGAPRPRSAGVGTAGRLARLPPVAPRTAPQRAAGTPRAPSRRLLPGWLILFRGRG